MTQLPLLVKELLGWYIWKDKIKECNKEYHKIIVQYDEYGEISYWTTMTTMTIFTDQYRNPLLYRNIERPDCLPDYFIYNFTRKMCTTVANLPQRYFYSSGINNEKGFFNEFEKDKRYKKVNSWLFQL
jgi:hypothetical protein